MKVPRRPRHATNQGVAIVLILRDTSVSNPIADGLTIDQLLNSPEEMQVIVQESLSCRSVVGSGLVYQPMSRCFERESIRGGRYEKKDTDRCRD